MSGLAAYVFRVVQASGLSASAVRYRLPYAQGLQLLALQLRSGGTRFLGPELAPENRFSAIAGL